MVDSSVQKMPVIVERSEEYEACTIKSWQDIGPYFHRRDLTWSYEDRLAYFRRAELFSVICKQPVGFFMVTKSENRFVLVDIHVYESCRNQGYGREILRLISDMALAQGFFRVWLSVFHDNPAVRLYKRAGYKIEAEQDTGCLMSCEVGGKSAAS